METAGYGGPEPGGSGHGRDAVRRMGRAKRNPSSPRVLACRWVSLPSTPPTGADGRNLIALPYHLPPAPLPSPPRPPSPPPCCLASSHATPRSSRSPAPRPCCFPTTLWAPPPHRSPTP